RGLRLDRRRDVMPNRVGANGASIVPGNSDKSAVYLKLIGKQAGLRMPPAGPLSGEQIEIVKSWIDQGADWPDELSGEIPAAPADPSFARMMSALRRADRQELGKILREDSQAANRKGPGGAAPIPVTWARRLGPPFGWVIRK